MTKVIDIAIEGTLLSPAPGRCEQCDTKHEPGEPHNQDSLYWQYSFYRHSGGTWPTWEDAMTHCLPAVREAWSAELKRKGVKL